MWDMVRNLNKQMEAGGGVYMTGRNPHIVEEHS